MAINFHRDAITGDVVIASCSDVFAERGIVFRFFFFFLLLLFRPCLEAFHEPRRNLTHQTRGKQVADFRWHRYGKIATEGERESGESTDGPSFNTSVPQLSCRQEMNYDDIKKQNN